METGTVRWIKSPLDEYDLEEKGTAYRRGCFDDKSNRTAWDPIPVPVRWPHGVRRLIGHPKFPQECNIPGGDVCFPTASALEPLEYGDCVYRSGHCPIAGRRIDILLAPGKHETHPLCGRIRVFFRRPGFVRRFGSGVYQRRSKRRCWHVSNILQQTIRKQIVALSMRKLMNGHCANLSESF